METLTCRLLPFAQADGPHNMAADEVLLEAAERGVASFRLYSWSPPTLSLGYFQPERVRLQDPLLAALPFVRRASGGDTLVHDHELTYALAVPAGDPWQPPGERPSQWLIRMHAIIALALRGLGIVVSTVSERQAIPFQGILCFQHQTAGDLVIGSHKIVGSAQRRRRGALLQHGAILLTASTHTPNLPGIRELTGHTIASDDLVAIVPTRLADATNWKLVPTDWTRNEHHRIETLAAEKYTQTAWNRKRG